MRPYRVIYSKKAKSDISKLDSVVKRTLRKKIDLYSVEPLRYAKKLMDQVQGNYRWRVGNYRVIFDIESTKIIVLRVRHRREVYKK